MGAPSVGSWRCLKAYVFLGMCCLRNSHCKILVFIHKYFSRSGLYLHPKPSWFLKKKAKMYNFFPNTQLLSETCH
jgi:hypothetical protein